MPADRTMKATRFLERVAGISGSLESLGAAESAIESLLPAGPIPDQFKGATEQAAKKISTGDPLNPHEQFALEAIIIPDKRPAVDIIDGDYRIIHPLWTSFNTGEIKAKIKKAIPSVGRVELPHHPLLPYGGTGFVVGQDLLMTNRHVAGIFSAGLGLRGLNFLPGREAGIDFLQEKGVTTPHVLAVREVMMIHPYWDMALLRVEGLPSEHLPLALSLKHTEDLLGEDVAVIGYPAFDPRNDANVQNTVFGGVYDIKRLQPGKIGERRSVASFGKNVLAATHDSSTLGGNSGSVVLSAKTGQVVGLHFAGVYLDANYAVPSAELARDGRVIDAGVNFEDHPVPEPRVWDEWWQHALPDELTMDTGKRAPAPAGGGSGVVAAPEPKPKPAAIVTITAPVAAGSASVSVTIPLEISVRLGGPGANHRAG
jgi:Trypsin-like peptidase domain